MLVLTLLIMGVATFTVGCSRPTRRLAPGRGLAGGVECAGLWRRRRMGRRGADGHRARRRASARLLWQLAAGGVPFGCCCQPRVRGGDTNAPGAVPLVGMAGAFLLSASSSAWVWISCLDSRVAAFSRMKETRRDAALPIVEVVTRHWRQVLLAIGAVSAKTPCSTLLGLQPRTSRSTCTPTVASRSTASCSPPA
jgi:hypothetical protein